MYFSLGREGDPLLKEEWSSNIKVEQLLLAEDKYQKAVQNLIESNPPLKASGEQARLWWYCSIRNVCGMMKRPSVAIWEEETEMSEGYERKVLCEHKNTLLTPSKEELRSL
ncbi:hypothetical protein L345_01768 [Ophiophagus hannah]|uniref:Uncharacterized protein n=1 Tax=Ophiophagus hannah TaxID=8665 RepID=V8PEL5_OPHHA|nr:hypothetical protein L345_01768 [Ophiophagus hannah]